MIPVIWSPEARVQLRDQGEWLRRQGSRAALRMVNDVLELSFRLGREVDRGLPGRFHGTREYSIPKWHKVLIYRRSERQVDILVIIDTRMEPPESL